MDETRNPQQQPDPAPPQAASPPAPAPMPPAPAPTSAQEPAPYPPAAEAPAAPTSELPAAPAAYGGTSEPVAADPYARPQDPEPNPFASPEPATGDQFAYPPPAEAAYQRPDTTTYQQASAYPGASPYQPGAAYQGGPVHQPGAAYQGGPIHQGSPGQHHTGPFGPTGAPPYPAPYGVTGPAKSRRRGAAAGIAAAAIALALISGVTGSAATLALTGDDSGSAAPVITREVSPASTKSAAAGTVEAAAATINPSVVTLQVVGSENGQTARGTGSGVVIRPDGYILTNNHVVAPAANGGSVKVFFSDGTSKDAKIVGRDPSNDLAVVKVDGVDSLKAATFADSSSLKIGQPVLAVGAPLGLSGTVTEGIISAVNRPVRTGDGTGQDAVIDAIQTDAAINPGNSGGPLVDLSGRVIGINSAIATVGGGNNGFPGQSSQSGNIGVGFAIPANDAVKIAQQLIENGKASHATLGVSAQDSADGTGATVASVVPGSAASKAGLRAGDVITAVGSRRVVDVDSLVAAVRDHQSGDKVGVTYVRGGKSSKVVATLGNS